MKAAAFLGLMLARKHESLPVAAPTVVRTKKK